MKPIITSSETREAFEDLLSYGDVNSIEESLLQMYLSTLESQPYLGKLTERRINSHLSIIRHLVKALRLVEAESQFSSLKV